MDPDILRSSLYEGPTPSTSAGLGKNVATADKHTLKESALRRRLRRSYTGLNMAFTSQPIGNSSAPDYEKSLRSRSNSLDNDVPTCSPSNDMTQLTADDNEDDVRSSASMASTTSIVTTRSDRKRKCDEYEEVLSAGKRKQEDYVHTEEFRELLLGFRCLEIRFLVISQVKPSNQKMS